MDVSAIPEAVSAHEARLESEESTVIVEVTHITVYIQKYGADVLTFHTRYPEPLEVFTDEGDTLDLTCRAPRLKGEEFARKMWPEADIRVEEWTEKRGYGKPD